MGSTNSHLRINQEVHPQYPHTSAPPHPPAPPSGSLDSLGWHDFGRADFADLVLALLVGWAGRRLAWQAGFALAAILGGFKLLCLVQGLLRPGLTDCA